MSEQQLRDALQGLTGPASPPGSAEEILGGVRRRRTRRAVAAGIGVVAAAAMVAAALVWSPWRGEAPLPAETESTGSTGAWEPIAAAPLSPRTSAASVWTGSEMIVVGGTNATCPEGADCAGPSEDQLFSDGAAYDPGTDSWRSSADAPAPVLGFVGATWTGTEMVIAAPSYQLAATGEAIFTGELIMLAYDPAADSWRTLPDPPAAGLSGGLWAGDRIVYWHADETVGQGDWTLDPTTGTWAELPNEPLPEAFDRSYVWDGSRLIVAGLPNVEGATFRLAALDPASGEWTELPESPVRFWGQRWFFFDGHVVNPVQNVRATGTDGGADGALNLATGEWTSVPQAPGDADAHGEACQMPAVGAAGDWLSGGYGALVSLDPAVAMLVPPCGQTPTVAVWTGTAFVIWGGEGADATELSGDGWAWTPPPPS